jgi:hypothetical protein
MEIAISPKKIIVMAFKLITQKESLKSRSLSRNQIYPFSWPSASPSQSSYLVIPSPTTTPTRPSPHHSVVGAHCPTLRRCRSPPPGLDPHAPSSSRPPVRGRRSPSFHFSIVSFDPLVSPSASLNPVHAFLFSTVGLSPCTRHPPVRLPA